MLIESYFLRKSAMFCMVKNMRQDAFTAMRCKTLIVGRVCM